MTKIYWNKSNRKSSYRKEKTNKDRTLNKDSHQWSKWIHTMSARQE